MALLGCYKRCRRGGREVAAEEGEEREAEMDSLECLSGGTEDGERQTDLEFKLLVKYITLSKRV